MSVVLRLVAPSAGVQVGFSLVLRSLPAGIVAPVQGAVPLLGNRAAGTGDSGEVLVDIAGPSLDVMAE